MDNPQLILQDESEPVRVGDPESPILPGDYSPSGGVYRQGQFAPSLDELSTLSLTQAGQAGLINKNLPIFDGDEVSESKLKKWNPNNEFYNLDFATKVPKYSSAVIVDALQGKDNLLDALNLRYVMAGDRPTQDSLAVYGETIIAAEFRNVDGKFQGILRVFPSFYKYVSVPLIGYIPQRTSGLSIATYAVYHALGHLLFSRLQFEGHLSSISKYLDASGWSRYTADNQVPGSFMSIQNETPWQRTLDNVQPTELGRYSPADDFAESFAMLMTHKEYLLAASRERYDVMVEILENYGYVLQD